MPGAQTQRRCPVMTDAVEEVNSTGDSSAIHLLEQSKYQHAEEVVIALYEDAESIKRDELAEALNKLGARGDVNDVQRDVVRRMADAIVDQLLAAPTMGIYKARSRSTLDTAVHMLDLEVEIDDERACGDSSDRLEAASDDD